MSTRSTIAIERKDGTRTAIYCHWDGYIEGVGVTLQLAYNTAEKVEELLKLGNISSLRYYTEPKTSEHNFEHPEEDVCVAYCRDRGEDFAQSDMKNEFNYTFDEEDACWYVEKETFVRDTDAQELLGINYYLSYPRTLLLDEIMACDFKDWRDDEFASAGNVKEACIDKALEPRRAIIEEQRANYDAYLHAYCD